MRRWPITLLTLLASAIASAETIPAGAVRTAELYADALNRRDCIAMASMFSVRVRERLGGINELQKIVCGLTDMLFEGTQYVVESVQPPYSVHREGSTIVVFVPFRRTWHHNVGRQVAEGTYVVHSDDYGMSWSVFDQACADERWIRQIAPRWQGDPAAIAMRIVEF